MKNKIKYLSNFILGVMTLLLFMSTAIASPVRKNIEVTYNSVNITVNGDRVSTDNLLYQGITYVPLRAVSEMLGKEVAWNSKTNTASIYDTDTEIKNTSVVNSKSSTSKTKKNINVTYNSVNMTVNGKEVFADNLLYQGITYVPLRAVSEMLGKEVAWNSKTNTASINDKGFKEEVLDTVEHESLNKNNPNYDLTLTAVELFNNFEIDESKFYNYYIGKVLKIEGIIKNIDIIEDNFRGTPFYTIVLDAGEGKELNCYVYIDGFNEGVDAFTDSNAEVFGDMRKLKVGEKVKVKAMHPSYYSELNRINVHNTYLDE